MHILKINLLPLEPKSISWQLLQSTANLIAGGIRRMKVLPRIDDRLPQPDVVLQKSQNPLTRFQNISLKTVEKEIFDLVDGQKNFGVLLNTATLISSRAKYVLYSLLEAGLIEPRTSVSPVQDELSIDEEEEAIETGPEFKIQNTGGNCLLSHSRK